jgi:DNA repair exonuclease SbcCD nuclease subunit
MKIPCFADLHLSGTNSENYVSNYYEDTLALFKETLSIAKENKSPFILDGGDLIDSPIISTIMVDEIIDLVEANGIPLYCLTGNHPLFGHSWELSKATSLAHIFRRTQMIKKLDLIETDDCIIKGYDYFHDCEAKIKEEGLFYGKKTKKWKIALVHAFLTKDKFLPSVLHIPIVEINTDYDLVLSGHNHHPFSKIIDETKFVNIGCLGRRDINEGNIEPSIALLDTEKQSVKIIKLKSAKHKEEIFDLAKVAQNKTFEDNIDKFIASLETTKFTELDILGQIKEIGKKENIDPEVIKEVENRILTYQK